MCRCVDLGSTNTSFLSGRFIGLVSWACSRSVDAWEPMVRCKVTTRYRARADKSTNAPAALEPHRRGAGSRQPRYVGVVEPRRVLGASRTIAFLNLMPFVVLALSWALLGAALHTYHV